MCAHVTCARAGRGPPRRDRRDAAPVSNHLFQRRANIFIPLRLLPTVKGRNEQMSLWYTCKRQISVISPWRVQKTP